MTGDPLVILHVGRLGDSEIYCGVAHTALRNASALLNRLAFWPVPNSNRFQSHRSWSGYLDEFHQQHPGITEQVLGSATAGDGVTAYQWLVSSIVLGDEQLALDLACGSGPVQAAVKGFHWIGLDRSQSELAEAARLLSSSLVRGDADHQPFSSGTFDLLTCSMALMLFNPVEAVLSEISRVVKVGGILALLLPGSFPLSTRDRIRYARLLAALHETRPAYPNGIHLGRLRSHLERHHFVVLVDERRCFRYQVTTERHAHTFVDSLYVPSITPKRLKRSYEVAIGWTGSTIGVPLRKVVCQRVGSSELQT